MLPWQARRAAEAAPESMVATRASKTGRPTDASRKPVLPYEELHSLALRLVGSWDELTDPQRRELVDGILVLVPRIVHSVANAPMEARAELDAAVTGGPCPHVELASLTPRERQVLARLAAGEPTAEIARALGVTTDTVRTHVKRTLAKLGVHSRVEAVSLYLNQR